jgi:hypothetical protein
MRMSSVVFAIGAVGLASLGAGCAQTKAVKGWQPTATVGNEKIMHLPRGQFTVEGESVTFYRPACALRASPKGGCPLMEVGRGRVVEDLGRPYAAVAPIPSKTEPDLLSQSIPPSVPPPLQ